MPPSAPADDTSAKTTLNASHVTVILVAHGSTRRPDAAAAVCRHAENIRKRGIFADVDAAFLMGGRNADEAAATVKTDTVILVPFMMTDGYLAGRAEGLLRDGLKAHGRTATVRTSDAVGTHPGIASLAADIGLKVLTERGLSAKAATLITVAHGSLRYPYSHIAAKAQTDVITAENQFKALRLALLEEPPHLDAVLAGTDGPAAVVGLFAAPGGHALDDVGNAIAASGRDDLFDGGPVGLSDGMADIAIARAREVIHAAEH
jgi:sirohydrochlorin cobaltochelatase